MDEKVLIRAASHVTDEISDCGRFVFVEQFDLDGSQGRLETGQSARGSGDREREQQVERDKGSHVGSLLEFLGARRSLRPLK
jgi:hypothetical protein